MFILLAGLMSAGFTGTISSRIGKVMRASGVAVTITSLTNVLAFASGATSTFKSVRNFCVYTGKCKRFKVSFHSKLNFIRIPLNVRLH